MPPQYSPIFPTVLPHYPHTPFPLSQLTTFPLTILSTTNRSLQNSNVLPIDRQGKHVRLIVRQLPMKAGWREASVALRDLAEAISITRSKISYSLIEPQPLLCTPACGYEFHAVAVYAHPTFTAPLVRSAFGIRSEICGGVFLQK